MGYGCKLCEAVVELKGELEETPVIVGNANTALPGHERKEGFSHVQRTDLHFRNNLWTFRNIYQFTSYCLNVILTSKNVTNLL